MHLRIAYDRFTKQLYVISKGWKDQAGDKGLLTEDKREKKRENC
ncbi:MAG: hypothetical protein WDN26_02325 [Chitinophagaceae bacterium]